LSKTNINKEYLKIKLEINDINELKNKLLDFCDTLNFEELTKDVEIFLFDES